VLEQRSIRLVDFFGSHVSSRSVWTLRAASQLLSCGTVCHGVHGAVMTANVEVPVPEAGCFNQSVLYDQLYRSCIDQLRITLRTVDAEAT
jgi:hypothetical protein